MSAEPLYCCQRILQTTDAEKRSRHAATLNTSLSRHSLPYAMRLRYDDTLATPSRRRTNIQVAGWWLMPSSGTTTRREKPRLRRCCQTRPQARRHIGRHTIRQYHNTPHTPLLFTPHYADGLYWRRLIQPPEPRQFSSRYSAATPLPRCHIRCVAGIIRTAMRHCRHFRHIVVFDTPLYFAD